MVDLLVGIAWYIIVFVWDLWSDYKKWLSNRKVRHSPEYWMRIALLITPSIILASRLDADWWLGLFVTLSVFGSVWWLFFDGLYNKLRGFDWTFEGSKDKDESIWDDFVRWLGKTWTLVLKILLVAGSVTTFVKMLA